MAVLARYFIRSYYHTKSGQPGRYGFSTDSGWSNNYGSLNEGLSTGESNALFGDTTIEIAQSYVHYYSGQWEYVLTLKEEQAYKNIGGTTRLLDRLGWNAIVNAESNGGIMLRGEAYSVVYSGDTMTYKWRQNDCTYDVKEMRTTNSSAGAAPHTNGEYAEFVMCDDQPANLEEVLMRVDVGFTNSGESLHAENFSYRGPELSETNYAAIIPTIRDIKLPIPASSGYQVHGHDNIGPMPSDTTGCTVFMNIGNPIGYGTTNTGTKYLEFQDWAHGDQRPSQGQGGGYTQLQSGFDGVKMIDDEGYVYRATLHSSTPGEFVAGASDGRSDKFKIYFTVDSDNKAETDVNPTNRLFYIEWPDNYVLHNQRNNSSYSGTGKNRYQYSNVYQLGVSYYASEYTTVSSNPIIILMPDNSTQDYYSTTLRFYTGKDSNNTKEYTYITVYGSRANSQITTAATSNDKSVSQDIREETILLPYGGNPLWYVRDQTVGNHTSYPPYVAHQTVTTAGCTVVGDNLFSGRGVNNNYAKFTIKPNAVGERFRCQARTYYGYNTKTFTLSGHILDASRFAIASTTPSNSTGGTTYGQSTGHALVGAEGIRLQIRANGTSLGTNIEKVAGQVEVAQVISMSGGTLHNTQGVFKVDSPYYYHDSTIFKPDMTSSTWSVTIKVTVAANTISHQRSYQCVFSGTWKPSYGAEILNADGGTRLDGNCTPIRWAASGSGNVTIDETITTTSTRQPASGNYYYYNSAPQNGTQVTGTDDYYWEWESISNSTNKLLRIYWQDVLVFGPTSYGSSSVTYMTSLSLGSTTYYRGNATASYSGGKSHYKIHRQAPVTTYSESVSGTPHIDHPAFTYIDTTDYAWINNSSVGFLDITMDYTNNEADIGLNSNLTAGLTSHVGRNNHYEFTSIKISGGD